MEYTGVFLRLRKDDKDEISRFCLSLCSYQLLAYTSCSIRNIKDGGCLEIKLRGGAILFPPPLPKKKAIKVFIICVDTFHAKNVLYRTFHGSDIS